MSRQRLGKHGESLAKRHLESMGYRVLKANHRSPSGEIDLVTEKAGTLVFVEVRTRTGASVGPPEESVTVKKREHLVAAAQEYMQATGAEGREWRIDLVAIVMGRGGRIKRLDVLPNAVEL